MKNKRIIAMILADVGLVIARFLLFTAAPTNDTAIALPMFGVTFLLGGVIAWAAFTSHGSCGSG
jgi:hypothetical protein